MAIGCLGFGGYESGIYAVASECVCHVTNVFEVYAENEGGFSLLCKLELSGQKFAYLWLDLTMTGR